MGKRSEWTGWVRMAIFIAMAVVFSGLPAFAAAAVRTNQVLLKYRELPFAADTWAVSFLAGLRQGPALKVPPSGSEPLVVGRLSIPSPHLGMAWDVPGGRLYLDLNRNNDLTDDPTGVFQTSDKGGHQTFTNVHLTVQTRRGVFPLCVDLELSRAGQGALVAEARARCCLVGRLELEGESFQIAYSCPFLNFEPRVRGGTLLVRPWNEAESGPSWPATMPQAMPVFTLAGESADGVAWNEVSGLFVGGRTLNCSGVAADTNGVAALALEVRSERPELGTVRVLGSNLHRLVLTGSQGKTVNLAKPRGAVLVPVGLYFRQEVVLRPATAETNVGPARSGPGSRPSMRNGAGPTEATAYRYQPLEVKAGQTNELRVGAPLTNQVRVSRRGEALLLDYSLVDGAGLAYRVSGESQTTPPQFEIWQGPRRLAAGDFEYG